MAGRAALDLCGWVFEYKRPLFVRVTFDAGLLCAPTEADLLLLESAVLIVTIRTLHRAFEDAVMKGLQELGPGLVVAGNAELRLGLHKELRRRLIDSNGGEMTRR